MNNENNNNHNGKEVNKVQLPKNGNKGKTIPPVNRTNKNNPDRENKVHSEGPKKIPINVNKKSNNPNKSAQKGQVIKLGDRENKIHQGPPIVKKVSSQVDNTSTNPPLNVIKQDAGEVYNNQTSSDTTKGTTNDKQTFNVSPSTGKLLLVISAILFIAWAVTFFYYKIGGNIHMLLALAIIGALISLMGTRNKVK